MIKRAPIATSPPPAALPDALRVAIERVAGPDAAQAGSATAALFTSILELHDEVGTGLLLVDLDFRPLYASRALLKMMGTDLPAFLAKPSSLGMFSAERRLELEDRQRRRLRGEPVTATFETQVERGDGRVVDVELSSLHVKVGTATLVLQMFRDITRRKQTQRLARVGTWDWDTKNDLFHASDETWSILGQAIPSIAVKGDDVWKNAHPEDRPHVRSVLDQARTKPGPFLLDFRIVRPEGTTRFLHVEGSSLETAAGIEIRGSMQDVTDLRFAEQSLQGLTKDLMRSNDELEQFAYVASHDLREPLRIIAGYLGILERRYSKQLPAEAQKFIDAAVEGAARMEQLISHMLEYSRVGTRAGDRLPTESQEALDEAKRNLRMTIHDTKAEIVNGPLPVVVADRAQLVQLFQNFLSNALKFRRGDPPRVNIAATRRGNEWEFTVEDNGIGIEEADYERIFELFQRLHSAQEYAGSGIGLAIAKKIVERHGGRLWVTSIPGSGSTFHFTLPIPT